MKRCVIPALCLGLLSATAVKADTTTGSQAFSMSRVQQTAGQYGQYIGSNVRSMDPLGSLGGNAGYKNTGSGNIGAFNSGTGNVGAFNGNNNTSSTSGNHNIGAFNGNGNTGEYDGNANVRRLQWQPQWRLLQRKRQCRRVQWQFQRPGKPLMAGRGPSASVRCRTRQAIVRLFDGNSLAVCTLLAAIVVADASTVVRIADLPIGRGDVAIAGLGNFNGNGNRGSFKGNGNAGSFNGNANCGSGLGNGFSSDGNGNGKRQDVPDWCRFLKSLNGQLGLPPGMIPDFD